jgi:hypothetical protein
MEDYLARLPRGLESYPDYLQKASAYREFLTEIPPGGLAALSALPRVLLDLVERPRPVTSWVPEVHCFALFLAIADRFLTDDTIYLARKLAANRRLLGSPLYRLLFVFVSPETLLRGLPSRWAKFHQGLVVKVVEVGAGRGKVRLEYPHHLLPDLQVQVYAKVLQAAIEAAGGKQVSFEVSSKSTSDAVYSGTWSHR